MNYDLSKFKKGLEELEIALSEEQFHQFMTYYEMLIEKNKVMNLTAITEYDEVIEKHFLDSLSLVKTSEFQSGLREESRNGTRNGTRKLLDLGTGAGFPGIPLKIAFPELDILLVDSLNKRIQFLKDVIGELHLTGIDAVHGRAEEMARRKEYRESFDFCVSRAVANLASLSEYCLPFVRQEGNFISYKSGDIEEEWKQSEKAVHVLGGKLKQVLKFQLPNTEMSRSFVVIEKVRPTPKAYPRKAGTPSKEPIH